MAFKVQKAVREKNLYKGSTYGSFRWWQDLLSIKDLLQEWKQSLKKITGKACKILMANTEGARGRYYANEFDYDIIDLVEPFNPEQFRMQLILL